jgi:translocation protein SEC72
MRLELDSYSKIKNVVHAFQGALLVLAMILTVAILTRPGETDGRVGWYFALCWLTIPILVYLVMVPMWSRARRFSNVYAYATLDGLSTFLWLTAWASTASYVASGKGKGDDDKKKGCDNFKYGSPGRCKLSTGVTFLGVMIMLTFAATFFFSFRSVMTYKRTGMMPVNAAKYDDSNGEDFSAQTQQAFSSNMRTDEFDDDQGTDARQGRYAYQQPQVDEEYAPIHQNDHDHDHDDIGNMHATQPMSPLNQNPSGLEKYDTSYGGAHGQHTSAIGPDTDPRADYGRYGR